MSATTRHEPAPAARSELTRLSAPTVWRLTAAVHVALVVSLVLLVGLRQLGLHLGVAGEAGLIGLLLAVALLIAGKVGRE